MCLCALTLKMTFLAGVIGVTCLFFLWSANPVHGVLTLVAVGLSFAVGLLVNELEFVALIVLLVYVGAVTVLFVFVVMMVNLRVTPGAYVTAESAALWVVLAGVVATTATTTATTVVETSVNSLLNLAVIGHLLYTTEAVATVVVTGLVLFIAMVSAICLSLVSGENYRTQEIYSQIRKSNAVFVLQ